MRVHEGQNPVPIGSFRGFDTVQQQAAPNGAAGGMPLPSRGGPVLPFPCALLAPTRKGASTETMQMMQAQVARFPVAPTTAGAASPGVPLATLGSCASTGSILNMPTHVLPGQGAPPPVRAGRQLQQQQPCHAWSPCQQPQAVGRQFSGAAPPAAPPPQQQPQPEGCSVTHAAPVDGLSSVGGVNTNSRAATPQKSWRADPVASTRESKDSERRTSPPPNASGLIGTPKREAASARQHRSVSPIRRSEEAEMKHDTSKRRTPARNNGASGTDEASVARGLQRELEELRYENSRLQEKLCKSRSLALHLQRQADEARAERDKEHRRAEGLQTQLQQLNKQLRREISRGQQLERNLSDARHRPMMSNRDSTPLSLRQDEETTPLRQRAGAPSPLRSNSHRGERGANSGSTAAQHASFAFSSSCATSLDSPPPSATSKAAASDPSLEGVLQLYDPPTPEVSARDHGGPHAALAGSSLNSRTKAPPAPVKQVTLNDAPEIDAEEHDDNGASAAQRSWEFVLQGQYEAIDQENFAAKLVSCFPDDAVERACSRGVAFICTRGRRMDSSVPNQDDFLVARHTLADDGFIALYGVFDGHGPSGHQCAAFARASLPESLFGQHTLLMKPEDTLREAFRRTQAELAHQPFDSQHSGTTAALALLLNIPNSSAEQTETWLFVAHVGDSRIILASHREDEPAAFSVTALTRDHRPDDALEAERVQKDGGEVRKLHTGSVRVYGPGQDQPGFALTRSLGDFAVRDCGVISEPEVSVYRLRPGIDALLMLGTDGLFEFCSNMDAASKILKEGISTAGLEALCTESRRQWALSSYNETVDDITAIVASLPTSPSMMTSPAG